MADQPTDVQNLSNLGGVYNNLGMLYDRQGRWADAEAPYRQGDQLSAPSFGTGARERLGPRIVEQAFVQLRPQFAQQNKSAAAAEVTLDRKKLWPRRQDRLYSVAQELTAACQAMDKQPRGEADAQQKYWQAAIDTLREALAAGLPAERLNDPSLKALSDREDFRELVVEARAVHAGSGATDQGQGRQLN